MTVSHRGDREGGVSGRSRPGRERGRFGGSDRPGRYRRAVRRLRRRNGVPGDARMSSYAVGQGYRNFTQTSDDEVIALLDRARDGFSEAVASVSAADPPLRDEEVRGDRRAGRRWPGT